MSTTTTDTALMRSLFDDLDADELSALNDTLRDDPRARAAAVRLARIAAALHTHRAALMPQPATSHKPDDERQRIVGVSDARPKSAIGNRQSAIRPTPFIIYPISIAAAALLTAAIVVVYLLAFTTNPQPDPIKPDRPAAPGPAVATLIEVSGGGDLRTPHGYPAEGEDFSAGEYTLDSGSAEFMLTNAVNVKLHGRTRLVMHNDMSMRLTRGSAVFTCPPAASGYTVSVPGFDIVDLGTRFAVHVDETGTGRVHVLEGNVRIDPTDGSASVELSGGQLARFDSHDGTPRLHDTETAQPLGPPTQVAIAESFESKAPDAMKRFFIGQYPPKTSITITRDEANVFGLGTDNHVLRLFDGEGEGLGAGRYQCFFAYNSGLGSDVVSFSFDFFEPINAPNSGTAIVRLINQRGPYSNGKVYSIALTGGRVVIHDPQDTSETSTSSEYTRGRRVRVAMVANHSDRPVRYTTADGIRELKPRRADLWIDGRLAAPAFAPVVPGREVAGFAILSPSTSEHEFLIDNIIIRRGPWVAGEDDALSSIPQKGEK